MRVQRGKKKIEMNRVQMLAGTAKYPAILLDLGTGDGKFVYRWAVEHPDTFCIGLDANGENLQEVSSKVTRKPARGGVPNALFVVAPVESLPDELRGLADTITINYPWGSLLAALARPDDHILQSIVSMAKPGATLTALLNYSVFQDSDYVERLGLPELDEDYVRSVLVNKYRSAGLDIQRFEFLTREVPHRTSWGQSLILGGGRETLIIEATVTTSSEGDAG